MVSSCFLILARLACSGTCERSRQPALAKFCFRKSIEHIGSQRDINLPDFVSLDDFDGVEVILEVVIFKKVTTFLNFEDMFRCYKHHRQLQNI